MNNKVKTKIAKIITFKAKLLNRPIYPCNDFSFEKYNLLNLGLLLIKFSR